jgi:hypothetical protein
MEIRDLHSSLRDAKVMRAPSPESDPVQKDVYSKGTGSGDSGSVRESTLQTLQSFDGSTINTNWGYGDKENTFNALILKGIWEKWGNYTPAMPPLIVKSTIAQESSFNPNDVSPSGYVGLMQLGKGEALDQGLSLEPIDERYIPEKNIMAGVGTIKVKHRVISNPLDFYATEDFAKNVAQYYKEKPPTDLQKWFLSLAAFNGGGGTVLRSMNYALAKNLDPRDWNNLIEPKDSPKSSPLYGGIKDIYGENTALHKYYEMSRYPVMILKRCGLITSEEAQALDVQPPDYEKGDDAAIPAANKKELIQQIKSNELPSDKDLPDPLPAVNRPGTRNVVDESRDSTAPLNPDADRTFGHKKVNGEYFDKNGNWLDLGTAVAADQLAGMPEKQRAAFVKITEAKPEEITPGDSSIMLIAPSEDWDAMVAAKPAMNYKEIDYSKIGKSPIEPKYIVMHYTGGVNDPVNGIWNWFNQNKGKPSTQFVVGKDGGILQMLPEKQMCSGTLDFNKESISIEVCGNFREQKETDEEFNATLALVKYLQKEYKIPDTHIISHRQVDNNFGHIGRKPDPGFRFMNRLYDALR